MNKEEMREGFEAWHCEQYKTHGMTGAPTRDMHNGVRDESYCSKKSQALWECWQETGGDAAKVEALKEEIERIEAGQQPVAWFRSDAIGCAVWKPGATLTLKDGDPLFTRSDAGEVDRLREELAANNAEIVAMVESALRRSFSLGQVYWQQADSDSTCQQNKSDQTMETQAQHILNVVKSINALTRPAESGESA